MMPFHFSIKSYLLLLVCFYVVSCSLYDPERIIKEGARNLTFECLDGATPYFLKGIFGEDSICIYSGENSYRSYFDIGNGFITLSPSITLGDLQNQESKSYVDFGFQRTNNDGVVLGEIRIKSQPQKFGTSLDSMVHAFIIPGLHPIRGMENDTISRFGFEIIIAQDYENPKLNPDDWKIQLTSAMGIQNSESYFLIREIILEENNGYMEGFIQFEFSSKMYLTRSRGLTGDFVNDFTAEAKIPIRYKR